MVIVAALEYRPKSEFERMALESEQEWNIPATLTSTQLALVGLAWRQPNGWLSKMRPAWERSTW